MLQVTAEVLLKSGICLAVLILLAATAGCSSGGGFQVIEHNIVISEYAADELQSIAVVRGVARNMGSWPLEGSGVSVVFYDYEGNKLGVYSSNCQHLEPGESWNFNIELRGREAWKVGKYSLSTFSN